MSPEVEIIGVGSHGHVRKYRNHEHEAFEGFPIVKSTIYNGKGPPDPKSIFFAGFPQWDIASSTGSILKFPQEASDHKVQVVLAALGESSLSFPYR